MSLILGRYGGRFPSAGYDEPPECAEEGGDGDKTDTGANLGTASECCGARVCAEKHRCVDE